MKTIDYKKLAQKLKGDEVERPNKAISGTLSGHAAGEPFEKKVYEELQSLYPGKVFKQYEYLNDLYLKHPKVISVEERNALFDSPTVLFLLSRGDAATKKWDALSLFEERQNETADIVYFNNGYFELIDVKTRNKGKNAQPPNIISAYKVAKMCALMIDNADFASFGIKYIEIDWIEDKTKGTLRCEDVHYADLFKANPSSLYINWTAATQLQFYVSELDQNWTGTMEQWARQYIRHFVDSAKEHCDKMIKKYVTAFEKYL